MEMIQWLKQEYRFELDLVTHEMSVILKMWPKLYIYCCLN